jgi:hypothetical protein
MSEGKSMHAIGLILDKRATRIKELEREVEMLKAGARPASHVRDLVLTALGQIRTLVQSDAVEDSVEAQHLLDRLMRVLADNIPGAVEVPKPAAPHADGIKPWKPLDHGPRDNEAAAEKYRTEPR